MNEVVGWLLVFLFTSLIGIIVWLAKGAHSTLEKVCENQDRNQREVSLIKNNLDYAKREIEEVYKKLEDVPSVLAKTTLIESVLTDIKLDISTIKKDHLDINKRLQEVEKTSALHKQWIELKGNT